MSKKQKVAALITGVASAAGVASLPFSLNGAWIVFVY